MTAILMIKTDVSPALSLLPWFQIALSRESKVIAIFAETLFEILLKYVMMGLSMETAARLTVCLYCQLGPAQEEAQQAMMFVCQNTGMVK